MHDAVARVAARWPTRRQRPQLPVRRRSSTPRATARRPGITGGRAVLRPLADAGRCKRHRRLERGVGGVARRARCACPVNQRAAIVLRYFLDWDDDEIARALRRAPRDRAQLGPSRHHADAEGLGAMTDDASRTSCGAGSRRLAREAVPEVAARTSSRCCRRATPVAVEASRTRAAARASLAAAVAVAVVAAAVAVVGRLRHDDHAPATSRRRNRRSPPVAPWPARPRDPQVSVFTGREVHRLGRARPVVGQRRGRR